MLYAARAPQPRAELDFSLLWLALGLLVLGLVMVYSASLAIAEAAQFTGHKANTICCDRACSSRSVLASGWPPSRCRCGCGNRLRPICFSPDCCCWWWC